MLKVSVVEKTSGFKAAVIGTRNSYNSWDKSDSVGDNLGDKDYKLLMNLSRTPSSERKFLRVIVAYLNITAPLYWWKQFDTYKVGTVTLSTSTMHTLTSGDISRDDFSNDYLYNYEELLRKEKAVAEDILTEDELKYYNSFPNTADIKLSQREIIDSLNDRIKKLNFLDRMIANACRDDVQALLDSRKALWKSVIADLPSSYNQTRTVMVSYEGLKKMCFDRYNHRLNEWRTFCDGILHILPYSELIYERK